MTRRGRRREDSHLVDLLLSGRGHGAVVGAVRLAVAVAGFAVGAGGADVPQLVPSLVLMLVVQHRLEVHHRPGVPGLRTRDTNRVKPDKKW